MPVKELCRNFQRGSCQYGARCKFLHVTPQQPKANGSGFGMQSSLPQQQKPNPFGFGTQSSSPQQQKPNPFGFGSQSSSPQLQKPNPFGFGVQSNSQSKGPNNFGNKPNQFKPFENKWSRFSPIPGGGGPHPRQADGQPQPQSTNHNCMDPETCKRLIAEDFENERPLWKLTCYSHWKSAPCDIVGDISYEELRAAAYDDGKRGLSLQSIIERERSLLSSKLVDFDNLLRNPYRGPASSVVPSPSAIPENTSNVFSPASQNSFPSSVSSFGQSGVSPNTGFRIRPTAPANSFPMQPVSFQNFGQAHGAFGINNLPSGHAVPTQTFGSSIMPNMPGITNNGTISAQSNQFSASAELVQNPKSSSDQPSFGSSMSSLSSNIAVGQATRDVQSLSNLQKDAASGDVSIWLKEKWNPGEIPEEAPPDAFV